MPRYKIINTDNIILKLEPYTSITLNSIQKKIYDNYVDLLTNFNDLEDKKFIYDASVRLVTNLIELIDNLEEAKEIISNNSLYAYFKLSFLAFKARLQNSLILHYPDGFGIIQFDDQVFHEFMNVYKDAVIHKKDLDFNFDSFFVKIATYLFYKYYTLLDRCKNGNNPTNQTFQKHHTDFLKSLELLKKYQKLSSNNAISAYCELFYITLPYNSQWAELVDDPSNYSLETMVASLQIVLTTVEMSPSSFQQHAISACYSAIFYHKTIDYCQNLIRRQSDKRFSSGSNTLTYKITKEYLRNIKLEEAYSSVEYLNESFERYEPLLKYLVTEFNKFSLDIRYKIFHFLPTSKASLDSLITMLLYKIMNETLEWLLDHVTIGLDLLENYHPTQEEVPSSKFDLYSKLLKLKLALLEYRVHCIPFFPSLINNSNNDLLNDSRVKINSITQKIDNLSVLKASYDASFKERENQSEILFKQLLQEEKTKLHTIQKNLSKPKKAVIPIIRQSKNDSSEEKNDKETAKYPLQKEFEEIHQNFHMIRNAQFNSLFQKIIALETWKNELLVFLNNIPKNSNLILALTYTLIADCKHVLSSLTLLQSQMITPKNHEGQDMNHLTIIANYLISAPRDLVKAHELITKVSINNSFCFLSLNDLSKTSTYIEERLIESRSQFSTFKKEMVELNLTYTKSRIIKQIQMGEAWKKTKGDSYLTKRGKDSAAAIEILYPNNKKTPHKNKKEHSAAKNISAVRNRDSNHVLKGNKKLPSNENNNNNDSNNQKTAEKTTNVFQLM